MTDTTPATTGSAPVSLKDKLKKMRMPVDDINTFLAYVTEEKTKEAKKDSDKRPVTNNTDDMLYTMAYRWFKLGLVIDGVNVVITGRSMSMVTYHGYKNKVKQSYPDAKFDVQLVREGDTFSVSKKSGHIEYDHQIGDAFDDEKPIKGAYCVITIDGRDYFEALGKKDYTEMQNSSKQSFLWKKWESEFWLKSVIKRACKRHFYDVVKDIDLQDNEDYGIAEQVKASDDKKAAILAAHKGADNDNDTQS